MAQHFSFQLTIGEPTVEGWTYSPLIHFYEIWKDVKGQRIDIASNDLDVQIQGFVDNNKMYIALNNLDNNSKNVSLNFARGLAGLQNVLSKSVTIFDDKAAAFKTNTQSQAPSNVALQADETVVLEYTFNSDITFDNAIRRQKYYAATYLQEIQANTAIDFRFDGVAVADHGKTTLRMSLGRKHDVSKSPMVIFNGTQLTVPDNWKGYDQANRKDFFWHTRN